MQDIKKIQKGGSITIPKKIREKLNMKEGDLVIVALEGNRLVLEKIIWKKNE